MSRNSGDDGGATTSKGAGALDSQSDGQFGGLTPERRLQELRAKMERLSQMACIAEPLAPFPFACVEWAQQSGEDTTRQNLAHQIEIGNW
ncbi:hypothetical protein HPB50_015865 [Hyalomma asiaticum]|uniref:Uncharacterized protein n=1 Tax=Hyalomma asiaticum TaxID=266040 RepID=A0ACB7S7D7_HYAAI|nr:hypothetical protein HPB50_015865 [Hyalomma asiaticum]